MANQEQINKISSGYIDLSKRCFHSRKFKKCIVIIVIIFILACMAWGENVLHKLSDGGPIWPEMSREIHNFVYCDGVVFRISAWLFIIVGSGAVGGMINHAYSNLSAKRNAGINKDKKNFHDEEYSLLNFMLAGAGGALCVVWFKIALMSQEYPGELCKKDIFNVLSWSFVAGLFSIPLIELIQEKFIGAISKAELNEVKGEIGKEVQESKLYNRLLNQASTSLNTKDPKDMEIASIDIEKNIKLFPIDRPLHIYLGRLYRWQGKLDEAIVVLRKFVTKRLQREDSEGLNSGDKEALATAFYNIACYHCLKAEKFEKDEQEKNRLLKESLDALKEIRQYSEELYQVAFTDDDLDLLKKENPVFFERDSN